MTFGLAATRLSQDVGGGGWYSFIAIFFYPMAILSAFLKENKTVYRFNLFLVLSLCIIDVLSIGTRNSVLFCITFHLLTKEKYRWKDLFFIVSFFLGIVFLFEYTTRVRSGYEGEIVRYWLERHTYAGVHNNSVINLAPYTWAAQNLPQLLPFFYLISYLGHSIPEFYLFLGNYDFFDPKLAHISRYIAMITFSDTQPYERMIESYRINPGFYQTLYTSAFIDFGVILFLIPFFLLVIGTSRRFLAIRVYLIVVLAYSFIENYLYTGLGPVRFALFPALWLLFSVPPNRRKFRFRARGF